MKSQRLLVTAPFLKRKRRVLIKRNSINATEPSRIEIHKNKVKKMTDTKRVYYARVKFLKKELSYEHGEPSQSFKD